MTALKRRLVSPLEVLRRRRGRGDGRLRSLPILALSVHSACNCCCVMCDIWKANAERREISAPDLDRHVDAIRKLRVRRVMLTGGEPLLHSNLWALASRLRALRIRITLVTTGLLLRQHAADVVRSCDEIVVSVDGPREVHDAIRRVPGGFERLAAGVAAVRALSPVCAVAGRSVVQRENYRHLADTVRAARELTLDRISFLAADVTSGAFNRPEPWDDERRAEIALAPDDLPRFAEVIEQLIDDRSGDMRSGFIENSPGSLSRLYRHFAALAGQGPFPEGRCNAPWVSAVLEPGGLLRPCFFHRPYGVLNGAPLGSLLNSPQAIAFRQQLDVTRDATCRRCTCALKLGDGQGV